MVSLWDWLPVVSSLDTLPACEPVASGEGVPLSVPSVLGVGWMVCLWWSVPSVLCLGVGWCATVPEHTASGEPVAVVSVGGMVCLLIGGLWSLSVAGMCCLSVSL